MTLDLTLLGGFNAQVGEEPISLSARKARALLAYLALSAGCAFERDKLCALLWGETGRDQAHASLRQTLFRIRRVLPSEIKDAVVVNSRTLSLDSALVRVDAIAFTRCPEAVSSREQLALLAGLYRGPLLDGLYVGEAAFEEWLQVERTRFTELARAALAKLAVLEGRDGELQRAIDTRLRLLRMEPWDEGNQRELMRLYTRTGRRSAALAQYRSCAAMLQQELGVAPEAQTEQLYTELLEGRLGETLEVASPAPRPLPAARLVPSRPLVRREAEMRALLGALDAAWTGAGRVWVLGGEAGVGKTRLVEELVKESRRRGGRVLMGRCFESEQVLPLSPWVDALRRELSSDAPELHASHSPEGRAALSRLLSWGDPAPPERAGYANALRLFETVLALLADMSERAPVMVVLDDVHWADDMSLRLVSFLGRRLFAGGGPGRPIGMCLTLRSEERAGSSVLDTALSELRSERASEFLRVEPLGREDALELMRVLPQPGGGLADASVQEQIWRLSEGNPFVIVEAMRTLSTDTPASGPSALPMPERVRDVIGRHVGRLSPELQSLAAVAAVIGREFPLPLLVAVDGHNESRVTAAIEELVRTGIFRVNDDHLYFSHERIREVVYEGLLPQRRRLLHSRVAGALEALYADGVHEVYGSLAQHYGKAGQPRAALEYLCLFADRAAATFGVEQAMKALTEAKQHLDGGPLSSTERARAQLEIAVREAKCLFHLGRFADLLACLEPHRALLGAAGSAELEAQVHFWLGCAQGLLGNLEAAAHRGARALEEALRCGDERAARRAHTLLAWEALYAGDYERGVEHGLAATASTNERDAEVEYEASGFLTAGANYLYLGRCQQALEALQAATLLAQGAGVTRVEAFALGFRALVHAELSHPEQALELGERAVALSPDPVTQASTLSLLSHVQVRAGRTADVYRTLQQLAARAPQLGSEVSNGAVLLALSEANLIERKAKAAVSMARNTVKEARRAGHPLIEAAGLRVWGQGAQHLGQLKDAHEHLHESRRILGEIKAELQLGRTLCALASLARVERRAEAEAQHLQQARDLYTRLGLPLHAQEVVRYVAEAQSIGPFEPYAKAG